MSRLRCLAALVGFAALAGGAPLADAQTGDVPSELVDYAFPEDTELAAGAVYTVTGTLVVPTGVTLVLPPDVELRFNRGAGLDIFGKLAVSPDDGARPVLTANGAAPVPGDWRGIRLAAPNAFLQTLQIRYADVGIDVEQASGDIIFNCEVLDFKTTGIRLGPEVPDTLSFNALVENRLENTPGPRGTGIDVQPGVGIVVDGVRVSGMDRGIAFGAGSSEFFAQIAGSIIENSTVGVEVVPFGAPAIMDSSFSNNGTAVRFTPDTIVAGSLNGNVLENNGINLDLRAVLLPQPSLYDARSNAWGPTDPFEIAATILDFAEDARAPMACFTEDCMH